MITPAIAGVTAINDNRSVDIVVVAQGILGPDDFDSFSESAPTPFGPFASTPAAPTASTSEAFAQASASHSSAISPEEFTVAGHTNGTAWGDSFAGRGIATASSSFQVGFRSDSAFTVRIQGSLAHSRSTGQVTLFRGESTVFSSTDGAFDQTLDLDAGEYLAIANVVLNLNETSITGQVGEGTLVASFTFTGGGAGCPCVADFDGSGGTPDSTDIEAFFAAWLLGDTGADSDCSGGTPDSTDIDVFFQEWLAGGCRFPRQSSVFAEFQDVASSTGVTLHKIPASSVAVLRA